MSAAGGARIVVVSGPSGVGKTTVCDELVKQGGFARVVTATTRAPRGGERDGVDYIFLSQDTFQAWIDQGKLLEHAFIHQRDYYGTPRDQVEAALGRGVNALLNIDVQGAAQVREKAREGGLPCTTFFLRPPEPWEAVLKQRIDRRNDTPPEVLEKRMASARREMEQARLYDHQIVNDDLARAVGEIRGHLGMPGG